jgi:hypothetical protein
LHIVSLESCVTLVWSTQQGITPTISGIQMMSYTSGTRGILLECAELLALVRGQYIMGFSPLREHFAGGPSFQVPRVSIGKLRLAKVFRRNLPQL